VAISETQLDTWSHQGSVTQSAATYQTIKKVLEDPKAPYASRSFEIYLQGSYGNDTNIYADSDVDIAMCLTSVFYPDLDHLNDADKARYEAQRSPASYDFKTFKREVTGWLAHNFGSGVVAGNKAIVVPGNGTRRDADVLACAQHKRYYSFPASGPADARNGICFWTNDGDYIVNFPRQHSANCTSKHQATSQWFKPSVRIFKNMRNAMVDRGYLGKGRAPSYFLEGMLSNVPDGQYGSSYQACVTNAINWLHKCDPGKLTCANGLHWLVRDNTHVSWRRADFDAHLKAVTDFWNNSGARRP
jgi:hypothetical protein